MRKELYYIEHVNYTVIMMIVVINHIIWKLASPGNSHQNANQSSFGLTCDYKIVFT